MKQGISTRELEQCLLYRKCPRESLAAEEDARDRFWKAMNDQIRSLDFIG